MAVTVKDVALRAGVSHSTVSRALHNSPLISTAVAERIQKLAFEMGYFPSAAARTLKTRRSHVLGVMVSSLEDPFFSEILQGIEDGIQGSAYSLFIAAGRRDPGRERSIAQAMVEHSVDGVIISSTSFSREQSAQFLKFGVPMVVINNQAAEDFRYSIYHDDMDGSRRVTRHLLELGHTRIAYIGNKYSGRSNLDRLAGFRAEMEAAGLSASDRYIYDAPGNGPGNGLPAVQHFLGYDDQPSAYVCYNDMIAIGVLKGLQQHGILVPEQVSVAGFDNITFSAYTNPPLTTFDQPKRFIGAEAARLMLDLLLCSDPADLSQHSVRVLKGRLLPRESTGPFNPRQR